MMTSGGNAQSPPPAPLPDTDERTDIAASRVPELATLAVEPSAGFVRRVRHRIHRRVLASQVVDLSSAGVWQVAIEFLGMAFGLVERGHALEDTRVSKPGPIASGRPQHIGARSQAPQGQRRLSRAGTPATTAKR